MIRYVDQNHAAIWLELDHEAALYGTATAVRGEMRPASVHSDVARTVEIHGHHYAVIYFKGLKPATLYDYKITAALRDPGPIAWRREIDKDRDAVVFDLSELRIARTSPAFRTLPAAPRPERRRGTAPKPEPLRLAFGSCRAFGGGDSGKSGPDVLAMYAEHLQATASERLRSWPHLLLFLGDQIYADEVSKFTETVSLGSRARPFRRPLFHPDDALIEREVARRRKAGEESSLQLYSFDDYAITYRDAWTEIRVRQLLANVPSFMLPDDHEFTGGYNITGTWMKQAVADPAWRTTLANAMAAYWVYQGWGNLAHDAAQTHPFLKLLMQQLEGPGLRPRGGIGEQVFRLGERVVTGDLFAPVYYTIPTSPPIIAIDARTDRRHRGPAPPPYAHRLPDKDTVVHAHPEDQMLSDEQFTWLEHELARHDTPIVASSLPLLQMRPFDRLMGPYVRSEEHLGLGDTQNFFDGFEYQIRKWNAESWFAFPRSLNRLLKLLAQRKTTFVLAGDVHYSYVYDVMPMSYIDAPVPTRDAVLRRLVLKPAQLIQVVSSPLQNEPTDHQFKQLEQHAGTTTVDEHGHVPVLDFSNLAPGPYAWRDAYGDAVPNFWLPDARPASPPGSLLPLDAFGTRNMIASLEWREDDSLRVTFLGKDNAGRLRAISAPRNPLPAPK